MIKNQRQYRIVKAQAEKCQKAIESMRKNPNLSIPDEFRKAEMHALQNELKTMKKDIKSYEEICSGKVKRVKGSLESLAELLIKARQKSGLNQKQLASIVGCKEQQIQRYESEDYKQASFNTILRIASALGVNSEIVFKLDKPSDREVRA